ncbi:MAG: S8 family serine peptidase, partial [Gaiellaceae bacterium]
MSDVAAMAAEEADEEQEELLPAWSLPRDAAGRIGIENPLPERVDREWAFGGATGKGVRVCILDSGVERAHPAVGEISGAVVISVDEDGEPIADDDTEGDLCGHGTACAGVVKSLAPDAEIYSVRVLGAGFTGTGKVLLAGLRWAVAQGYDVVNMSLSTTKRQFGDILHELADTAYFSGTVLVAAAHNMPVESFPWRFSSVVSVGSHEEDDPLVYYANPDPPVEFFARGVDVDVAWVGGGSIRATGNSFATPC